MVFYFQAIHAAIEITNCQALVPGWWLVQLPNIGATLRFHGLLVQLQSM